MFQLHSMHMKNYILSCCLLFLSASTLLSQKTISGTIFDDLGNPLNEVIVHVMSTNIGTVTNEEGQYRLDVPEDSILIKFAYDSGWTSPEVHLAPAENVLNVVVTPYMPFRQENESIKKSSLDKQVTIRGIIFNERKEPLIGATVSLGNNNAVVTNQKGYYEIKVPPGQNIIRYHYDGGWAKAQVTAVESSYIDIFILPNDIIDRWERKLKGKKKKRRKN